MTTELRSSATTGSHRSEHGQFFTIGNPFMHPEYIKWKNKVSGLGKVIEPFAGSRNLVKMNPDLEFDAYDIEPQDVGVVQRDTIANFPAGYNVCITNPPYISKSSASKKKMDVSGWSHDDLYKICIEKCLQNCGFVAAIIPESFIISTFDKRRLVCVISITTKMFADTDCPVCLALFDDKPTPDFAIYREERYVGTYNDLIKFVPKSRVPKFKMTFNDPNGILGIHCLDNTAGPSIRFVRGETIESDTIKHYSRAYSRMTVPLLREDQLDDTILRLNEYIEVYRRNTNDVFMCPFKGVRKDGMYRRRLDFDTIRSIICDVTSTKSIVESNPTKSQDVEFWAHWN